MNNVAIFAAFLILVSNVGFSQNSEEDSQSARAPSRINLTGPRIGVTRVGGSDAEKLKKEFNAARWLLQFGWQFETEFLFTKGGLAGLSVWLPLIGGVEQGLFLPNITWLIGMRTAGGTELAMGPHISLSGVALAFGAGVTARTESMNFPVNLAVVSSKRGIHIALLFGFSARD